MARSTMTFHPSHGSLVSLLDVSRFLLFFGHVLFDIQRACFGNDLLFRVRFNSELFEVMHCSKRT